MIYLFLYHIFVAYIYFRTVGHFFVAFDLQNSSVPCFYTDYYQTAVFAQDKQTKKKRVVIFLVKL